MTSHHQLGHSPPKQLSAVVDTRGLRFLVTPDKPAAATMFPGNEVLGCSLYSLLYAHFVSFIQGGVHSHGIPHQQDVVLPKESCKHSLGIPAAAS